MYKNAIAVFYREVKQMNNNHQEEKHKVGEGNKSVLSQKSKY
jgi:hypothetical protein